jgi:hypothetical protein
VELEEPEEGDAGALVGFEALVGCEALAGFGVLAGFEALAGFDEAGEDSRAFDFEADDDL